MNPTFDPDEAAALRRAFAQDPARPTEDPVDADALWEAVQGEAGPSTVAALADRMSREPALAEDWRIAAGFAAAADEDAPHGEEPVLHPTEVAAAEPANHGDYLRWGALVAVVAAAVLLVLAWPQGGPSPYEADDSRMRGGVGSIEAIRGDGVVSRDDAVLEWSEVPGAVRYELHVSTPELEPRVERRDLSATSSTLPADLLSELPGGATLLWRIEAVTADERRVVSETFAVTVN